MKIWLVVWFLCFMAVLFAGCSRLVVTTRSGATAESWAILSDKSMGYFHYSCDPNGIEEIMIESLEARVVEGLLEVVR